MKLIVTEKNIAAKKLAEILAVGKPKTDKVYNTPVYTFRRDGEDWMSIGLKGHILGVDFPQQLVYGANRSPICAGWRSTCRRCRNMRTCATGMRRPSGRCRRRWPSTTSSSSARSKARSPTRTATWTWSCSASAIYEAPELVAHIMDCCGKFSSYIARTYAEVGQVPLMFMGEDIATTTGPIFKPSWVRREGLPRWRWIVDPIHQAGMKFLFHTDGRYGPFLPIIFDELGADGLNPIERNGCNDIFDIRRQYPHKLLFGNVCCAQTLPYGTPYDVEDETLELIEKIGPQGGIFIGSSSEVHDLVPVANVVSMYRTVHEYGHYPIDSERIRARRAALRRKGQLDLRADLVP